MQKAWGGITEPNAAAPVGDDDLQKRFDDLTGRYEKLEKVATDATDQIEGLVKRVKVIEDTPLPRAPRSSVAEKGDDTFFGKAATHEDKMGVLASLLKEHGADGVATMMIKASQASGGQQMALRT
jgi:hypothetical protein